MFWSLGKGLIDCVLFLIGFFKVCGGGVWSVKVLPFVWFLQAVFFLFFFLCMCLFGCACMCAHLCGFSWYLGANTNYNTCFESCLGMS